MSSKLCAYYVCEPCYQCPLFFHQNEIQKVGLMSHPPQDFISCMIIMDSWQLQTTLVSVNLDLRSSQRWLGLAHGLGTWFVVAHGIFPWYCMWLILYKAWGGSIVIVLDMCTVSYWIFVLYRTGCGHCIVLEERLWEREEEVQWFCCRAYPFIFLDWDKRTGNFFCGRIPSFGWTTLYLCLSVLF